MAWTESRKKASYKYEASPKGKANAKRYRKSEKGRTNEKRRRQTWYRKYRDRILIQGKMLRNTARVRAIRIINASKTKAKRDGHAPIEMTIDALAGWLEARKDQTLCDMCYRPQQRKNARLAVDHCHKTGKVRGLLCDHCNGGLGFLENILFVVKANSYLTRTTISLL